VELAFELEVIGRVGEDHIDRRRGQGLHRFDAIAGNDAVHAEIPHEGSMSQPSRVVNKRKSNQ
jgi:hypothetical protein